MMTKKKIIYMSNCGKTIFELNKNKKLNIPKNWKEQINSINEALTKENIYNNDICHTNVCIDNNKIYLIDFGCTQPLDLKLKFL